MPGCDTSVAGGGYPPEGCFGDEDHVNILPPPQFLSRYVFFTDPTYSTTNLALTRVRTGGAFHDVSVDCLGVVGGWKDVGTSGQYQVTNVDLMRDFAKVGTCGNGHHLATSDGPFGLVVWGLDGAASYAYPAGGNAAKLNAVVAQPLPK
jgi:hypothetical protein